METAESLIKDAFGEIFTETSPSLDPEDMQKGIRFLNRMMDDLNSNGTNLNHTEVTKLQDEITITSGAIKGVIYNLAIELSTSYDVAVTPELADKAAKGKRTMVKIGRGRIKSNFPSTLPRGSGNEQNSELYPGDNFYPGCNEDDNSCEC